MKYSIQMVRRRLVVDVDIDEETGISNYSILFPKDQEMLDIPTQAMILSGGLALAIKSLGKLDNTSTSDIKEHELMDMVIDYLQREFVNNESFKGGFISDDLKNKKK